VTVADGAERPFDPRWVGVQRIVGWIGVLAIASPLLIAVLLVVLLASLPAWIEFAIAAAGMAIAGGMAWLAHAWPAIEHRHARYRVDALGLEVRRGVLWRRTVNVPRSRVQHTDVSQGPLERARGLGTLVVYTAGTHHAKVDVPGLDHRVALAIRDHLLPRERETLDAV
jgi:hypothetical protein